MKNIQGHTIDIDNVTENGWILNLGSRNFSKDVSFDEVMLDKGLNVISVDPYKNININNKIKNNPKFHFLNKACVGIKNSKNMLYYEYRDAGANSLYNKNATHVLVQNKPSDFIKSYEVETITISDIMKQFDVQQFDIIKMDIEGGEYDILLNFPKKCTKQLTVEFHDWLGLNPFSDNEEFYNLIENTTLFDYNVIIKNKTTMSGLYTYSDILYVLK